MMRLPYRLRFAILILAGFYNSVAQTPKHPGIDLYLGGKNQEAIASLGGAVKTRRMARFGIISEWPI
jgi:hypothetical protein